MARDKITRNQCIWTLLKYTSYVPTWQFTKLQKFESSKDWKFESLKPWKFESLKPWKFEILKPWKFESPNKNFQLLTSCHCLRRVFNFHFLIMLIGRAARMIISIWKFRSLKVKNLERLKVSHHLPLSKSVQFTFLNHGDQSCCSNDH